MAHQTKTYTNMNMPMTIRYPMMFEYQRKMNPRKDTAPKRITKCNMSFNLKNLIFSPAKSIDGREQISDVRITLGIKNQSNI